MPLFEAPTAREAAIEYAREHFAGGSGVVVVVPEQDAYHWRMESEWLVSLDGALHAERR